MPPRPSTGLLRSRIPRRPAPLHQTQRRHNVRGPDDLGGPGGQEKPPARPAGPDAAKRNWPAIGGAALAVVGGTAYLMSDSGPSKKELDELRKRDMESIRQRADEATRQGQEASRQVGGKSDLGAFRNE